jgi:DNA-binding NarL/FixJ family response regulator
MLRCHVGLLDIGLPGMNGYELAAKIISVALIAGSSVEFAAAG